MTTTTTTTTTAGLPESHMATFDGAHGDSAHAYYEGHDDEDEHSHEGSERMLVAGGILLEDAEAK